MENRDRSADAPDAFLASEFAPRPSADALFQVVPVPFEASVSYGGGTAGGPAAIIAASNQLEVWDGFSCPGEEGIATWPAVDCAGDAATVLDRVTSAVRAARAVHPEAVPVILGGEHTITAPAVRAVAEMETGPLGFVQIDAHADLRHSYEGSTLSHACVARRVHEDLALPVFQVGVRAISPEEVLYREDARTGSVPLGWVDGREVATRVRGGLVAADIPAWLPSRVYLTVDVDGLDPSIMGATGTPVAGGLQWYTLLEFLEQLAASRTIVAFDLVELAPVASQHAYTFTAADLVYRIMGMIQRSRLA